MTDYTHKIVVDCSEGTQIIPLTSEEIAELEARDAAYTPTPTQQAQTLLTGGLTLTSTGTPSLNGTYPADAATTAIINAEVTSILLNGVFADGTSTLSWPDTSGTMHVFPSPAEFKLFAAALASFVSGISKFQMGITTSLPSNTVTIA